LFRNDVAAHVDYLREQQAADDIIERWYDGLFLRFELLEEWPRSYPVDRRKTAELGREIRKLVFGRYVITYHVEDANKRVVLLAMVHGARRK
jgi:plasmid stabilization system protein ParE